MNEPFDQHAPGVKLDSGKIRPDLVFDGFARALLAVAEVATFGAAKYSDNGWAQVHDGQRRYRSARYRHQLAEANGETDDESGLLHITHEAWNILAELELKLRELAQDRRDHT